MAARQSSTQLWLFTDAARTLPVVASISTTPAYAFTAPWGGADSSTSQTGPPPHGLSNGTQGPPLSLKTRRPDESATRQLELRYRSLVTLQPVMAARPGFMAGELTHWIAVARACASVTAAGCADRLAMRIDPAIAPVCRQTRPLREAVEHYNGHRPHRGLELQPPRGMGLLLITERHRQPAWGAFNRQQDAEGCACQKGQQRGPIE